MKLHVMGIQSGTVTPGMTNSQYWDAQIACMEQSLAQCGDKPDLVMFPELMTGIYFGFVREKRWLDGAEDFLTGNATRAMTDLSRKHGVHICYSLYEKAIENGAPNYYNTMGLVSPVRGVIGKYRKIHLPGGDLRYNPCYEKYYFSSGDTLPVYELDNGTRVAMMLCYDRSFPEQWRAYYLKGAQVVLMAACTMGLRKDMFVTELRTRALESHTFVLALNRAGEEKTENEPTPRVHFGQSMIAGPLGDVVCSLQDEPWRALSATLDLDEVTYARGRLNWQRDRHPELYGIVSDVHMKMDGMIYERGF